MSAGVAVVSGAGGGIGAATAEALARTGLTIAALDRDAESLDRVVGKLRGEGLNIDGFTLDITSSGAVESVFDTLDRTCGPVRHLVNVAGILRPASLLATTDADWDQTLAVNVTGVFLLCRAAARRMVPRGEGAIVTVGSNAGGIPRTGMAGYAASKAAAAHLTRCLGLELAPHGIRCNIVSPGSTDTPMLRALGAGDPIAGDPATFRTAIPLGRVAQPADIADAVVFLLSDQARHITMHELYVDGGATLRA
ncbi:MAG: 2,3-dihydro-2,3-dihydroxybenzoate dehydrogenase [Streptosporangiaceae bacterium]